MKPLKTHVDIYKSYKLYHKLHSVSDLQDEIRRLFKNKLITMDIVTREHLCQLSEKETERLLREDGYKNKDKINKHIWVHKIRLVESIIIDSYVIQYLSDQEIEETINTVRRKEVVRQLSELTNFDSVSDDLIREKLNELARIPKGETRFSKDEIEGLRVKLIHYFISNQLPFSGIAKHYLSATSIHDIVVNHTINGEKGKGLIGGKAAGMFLATQILKSCDTILPPEPIDEEIKKVQFPESYFISSDVFDDFITHNNLTHFQHYKYKPIETIIAEQGKMQKLFQDCDFPSWVIEQISVMLTNLEGIPLIVRSSSLLEDNFGAAFSGKYPSIFLANRGSLSQRMNDFLLAIKQVYAAVFDPDPIQYRRKHHLLDFDESMAILVQSVVGESIGDYYFPLIAGVGFSTNHFAWTERINAEDGLLRFVMGLGTRAVDRVGDDYPRMVSLTDPTLRAELEVSDIIKYAQRYMDVINTKTRELDTISVFDLIDKHKDEISMLDLLVSEVKDGYLEEINPAETLGRSYCLTFDKLITYSPFTKILKRMLDVLEKAYKCPVDIEYAFTGKTLYILQCRPLSQLKFGKKPKLPTHIADENILFTANKGILNADIRNIKYIVYIDPLQYEQLSSEKKINLARWVGKINLKLSHENFILMGPGRWGSSNINLGVKVQYSEINNARLLVEIARTKNGYTNEVSFGTHFFQDLVEDNIIPLALYPDEPGIEFQFDFFDAAENVIKNYCSIPDDFLHAIKIMDIPKATEHQFLHVVLDGAKQYGLGYLDTQKPEEDTHENNKKHNRKSHF